MAENLRSGVPWYRSRRGHWLCAVLNNSATGLDPASYARLAQKPVGDGLRSLGFPGFVADTLGAASAFGAKQALSAIPVTHLSEVLRVLIALVCPNLEACPARSEVFKTYAMPVLGDHLRAMAGNA